MKKLLVVAMMAAGGALISACSSDFEASDNGCLDGFWHLTHVDTLATGRSGDVSSRMIFWSIQGGLVELSDRRAVSTEDEPRVPSIFYRFERTADQLDLLGDPKPRVNNRVKGDVDVADRMQCGYYGLSDTGEALKILRLEDKRMTLLSDYFRMYFRKY